MQSVIRMLPALVRQTEDSPEAREYAVFAAWEAAAGDSVRRVCMPTRLYGRQLLVATVDPTWKTQLGRLAPQLIFRMNSFLGAPLVTQIVFRVDPTAVANARPREVPPVGKSEIEACAAEVAPQAETIADPVLRSLFLRAAGMCLARRKREP